MDSLCRAVVEGDGRAAKRILGAAPAVVRARIERDRLVVAIPHWLYVGDTVLHLAAAALNAPAVRFILDAGADPNAQNRRGATPLHYACDPRPASGGVWNPRRQAEIIGHLLAHGADVERADRGGASPLHRAVRARSQAAVRRLLESGARVDCRLGKGGSTPLHLAVQATGAGGTAGAVSEQLEIVGLLLDHGANPKSKDARGKSVNDWAKSAPIQHALRFSARRGL
jgi:ankyrin repeat protein